jgi:hypothetical protein
VYNDGTGEALYAVGRFNSLNNVPGTSMVARWNGQTWSSVGGGLITTSQLFGLEAATVFDDGTGPALYVAGYAFTGSGLPACNVARWNGTSWTALGAQIGTGRITSIVGFDEGDGPTLYIGGTAMPQINYVARWNRTTSQWTVVDGGVTGGAIPPSNFPSVFGLAAIGNKLYVGGNFVEMNGQTANGLAARVACEPACYANCDGSTTAPVLNVDDFSCFVNEFAAAQALPLSQQVTSYANCDASTAAPVLNVDDFTCFINRFAAGCP